VSSAGTGDRDAIVLRYQDLDPEERAIDTSRPLLLSAYGEWTKKSGCYRLPNLVSFYNELYKSSGSPQQGIMEEGQVRMGTTPWKDGALYRSQSAVHQAEKITTPFLILHGTADGAVDWHQGLELYNAARRLGKEGILLSYPDEQHHLTKEENQKDFQVRMKQFFDHYLKGAEAPAWMTEGVAFLKK